MSLQNTVFVETEDSQVIPYYFFGVMGDAERLQRFDEVMHETMIHLNTKLLSLNRPVPTSVDR